MSVRKKQRRLSYRSHNDEQIRNAIRAACPEGSIFADYLEQVCLEFVDAPDEFNRGIAEGKRRLAGEILNIAMSKEKEITVEANIDRLRT